MVWAKVWRWENECVFREKQGVLLWKGRVGADVRKRPVGMGPGREMPHCLQFPPACENLPVGHDPPQQEDG